MKSSLALVNNNNTQLASNAAAPKVVNRAGIDSMMGLLTFLFGRKLSLACFNGTDEVVNRQPDAGGGCGFDGVKVLLACSSCWFEVKKEKLAKKGTANLKCYFDINNGC